MWTQARNITQEDTHLLSLRCPLQSARGFFVPFETNTFLHSLDSQHLSYGFGQQCTEQTHPRGKEMELWSVETAVKGLNVSPG